MTPANCSTWGGTNHSVRDKEYPEKIRVKEEAQKKYDQRMASWADVGMKDTPN